MAAGLGEIAGYFEEGKRQKATHMIVVCDTFDHEDYPVYATGDKDCLEKYDAHNGPNMQRVRKSTTCGKVGHRSPPAA